MAKLRKSQTEEHRAKHREAQRRYREKYYFPQAQNSDVDGLHRYCEQIAHRARRAAAKKNIQAGKETKRRPKARQYWSDIEDGSEDDEEDGEDW